jgi:hypothetical protein
VGVVRGRQAHFDVEELADARLGERGDDPAERRATALAALPMPGITDVIWSVIALSMGTWSLSPSTES